jgi:DNA polymerase (family 10)
MGIKDNRKRLLTNEDIAQVFEDIADLLTIRGESVYRVRAYRNAADSLRSLSEDVMDLWREERLEEIPGVGEAIAGKIDELLRTGRLIFYEKLISEVPQSLIEVLRIPDVGPKRAALFWKELGLTTVNALEEAAKEGKICNLPGMGERTQERILRGIQALKQRESDRVSLAIGWSVAEDLLGRLRATKKAHRVEPAGSLRRWKETIGDIDLLAAAAAGAPLIEAFLSFPEVAEVKARGDAKASVRLQSGLDVQLWVHPIERFGSAWQYATGSKDHSIHLREIAMRAGLSLSEQGFKKSDGSEILCPAEQEVYATLGLPWIPPELREDRGELQAAREGHLPDLISLSDMLGDLQVHSNWSDGKDTILHIAGAAKEMGHQYLAITDHSQSLGVAHGLSVERLRAQRQEIEKAQKAMGKGFRILHGVEVEIRADGTLDFEDEVLQEMDIVLAALHSSLQQEREVVTGRMLSAIRNPHVDIIAHPTGRLIGRREPADLDMERILLAAAEAGVALEINASPERLDLSDSHAHRGLELGCLFSINTDAHRVEELSLLKYGVAVARRGWIGPERVINTWPLDELLAWLSPPG